MGNCNWIVILTASGMASLYYKVWRMADSLAYKLLNDNKNKVIFISWSQCFKYP